MEAPVVVGMTTPVELEEFVLDEEDDGTRRDGAAAARSTTPMRDHAKATESESETMARGRHLIHLRDRDAMTVSFIVPGGMQLRCFGVREEEEFGSF